MATLLELLFLLFAEWYDVISTYRFYLAIKLAFLTCYKMIELRNSVFFYQGTASSSKDKW
jgi:hypothetical protein